MNNSIYSYDSETWIPLNGASTSYVPPNFQYSTSVASTIPVTVQGNPAGVSFSVDGTTYTTAQGFNWTSGSQHTLATTSPQGTGTQYVFTSWSDGGAISHTVSPTSATTYTANFSASSGGGRGSDGFHHRVRAEQSGGARQLQRVGGDEVHGGRKRDQRYGAGAHLPAGNSGTHTVKLVSVGTGADVAGSALSVNMGAARPANLCTVRWRTRSPCRPAPAIT